MTAYEIASSVFFDCQALNKLARWSECTADAEPIRRSYAAAYDTVLRLTNKLWRLEAKAARARSRRPQYLAEIREVSQELANAVDVIRQSGWGAMTSLPARLQRGAEALRRVW